MKYLYLVVVVILFFSYSRSQSNPLCCDSVFLKDGTIQIIQIQEFKKNKLIYILCCENCAVPRELSRKNVDTIIFHNNSKLNYKLHSDLNSNNDSSIFAYISNFEPNNILYLTSKERSKKVVKTKTIKINEKIIIEKKDATFVKGKLTKIDDEFITLNSSIISLNDISKIKRKNEVTKVVGSVGLGITLGIGSVATIAISSFSYGAAPMMIGLLTLFTIPPILFMQITQKYDLVNDWELSVHKID